MKNRIHLVFIHGMWMSAACWQEFFIPWFEKKGYSCSAFDLPAHEKFHSSREINRFGLGDYVNALKQHLDALPKDREIILAGHSMGALLVQKYLKKHYCKRVILITPAPVNGILRTTLHYIFRKHPLVFLTSLFTLNLKHITGSKKMYRELFYSDNIPDKQLSAYFDNRRNESFKAFFGMLFHSFQAKYAKQVEALVIASKNDFFFNQKDNLLTASRFSVQPVWLCKAAHNCMNGVHWLECAEIILSWLEKLSP